MTKDAPSTLERMASVLLVAAHATHRNGGRLSSEQLKATLVEYMERRLGTAPSAHTVKFLLRSGEAWLRSMNALTVVEEPAARFDREMRPFAEHIRHVRQSKNAEPSRIGPCDRVLSRNPSFK
jgi:hypothetical protein